MPDTALSAGCLPSTERPWLRGLTRLHGNSGRACCVQMLVLLVGPHSSKRPCRAALHTALPRTVDGSTVVVHCIVFGLSRRTPGLLSLDSCRGTCCAGLRRGPGGVVGHPQDTQHPGLLDTPPAGDLWPRQRPGSRQHYATQPVHTVPASQEHAMSHVSLRTSPPERSPRWCACSSDTDTEITPPYGLLR